MSLRWFALAFGWFVLALTASCADDTSCGGPTSDFPFCGGDDDAPKDEQSSHDPGAGGGAANSTGGGADPSVETNSGDGTTDNADGGVCASEFPTCAGGATPKLDVTGRGPSGDVHVSRVALVYYEGASSALELVFDTEIAQRSAQLVARIDGPSLVAPGAYGTGDAGQGLSVVLRQCGRAQALTAQLKLDAYAAVAVDGREGRLTGRLEIDEPGWTLSVPFDIRRACGVVTNP